MVKTVIEEVNSGIYRAEIPLPRNPLKATNAYLLKGTGRNLIIDTGMNCEESKTAMLEVLDELKVDLKKTDFFVTHLHTDHIGLVDVLIDDDAFAYFNRPDYETLSIDNLWQYVCSMSGKQGFPVAEVEKAIDEHPGQHYNPQKKVDYTMVQEGDVLDYAGLKLHCVSTPGHSLGHTCLYEPGLKWLFSGDHILGDITPNISTYRVDYNPLGDYLNSLDRVYEIPVDLVLPGHRGLVTNWRERIRELKDHHRQRLQEVEAIIARTSPCTAYTVASQMTWDLITDDWSSFPVMQKWFASGEALTHILYLEAQGKVERQINGEVMFFSST